MTGDLPSISNYATSNTTYGLGNLGQAIGTSASPFIGAVWNQNDSHEDTMRQIRRIQNQFDPDAQTKVPQKAEIKKEPEVADKTKRRLVQVFICDPDDNIPLEQCLLYSGEQKLTDATDQELFFEIDIKGILAAHNTKRVKVVNKKVKERVEHLEAAKVRDLKMVVVTAAEF